MGCDVEGELWLGAVVVGVVPGGAGEIPEALNFTKPDKEEISSSVIKFSALNATNILIKRSPEEGTVPSKVNKMAAALAATGF